MRGKKKQTNKSFPCFNAAILGQGFLGKSFVISFLLCVVFVFVLLCCLLLFVCASFLVLCLSGSQVIITLWKGSWHLCFLEVRLIWRSKWVVNSFNECYVNRIVWQQFLFSEEERPFTTVILHQVTEAVLAVIQVTMKDDFRGAKRRVWWKREGG